jgi:cold shock CspA family protein
MEWFKADQRVEYTAVGGEKGPRAERVRPL